VFVYGKNATRAGPAYLGDTTGNNNDVAEHNISDQVGVFPYLHKSLTDAEMTTESVRRWINALARKT
jgi:hypothetical protein